MQRLSVYVALAVASALTCSVVIAGEIKGSVSKSDGTPATDIDVIIRVYHTLTEDDGETTHTKVGVGHFDKATGTYIASWDSNKTPAAGTITIVLRQPGTKAKDKKDGLQPGGLTSQTYNAKLSAP